MNLFTDPILKRVTLAKSLGFVIAIGLFFYSRAFFDTAPQTLHWGFAFLVIMTSAIVGMGGVFTQIPLFERPFPVWLRGGMLGFWMFLVPVLFGWQMLGPLFDGHMGMPGWLTNPAMMLVDGFILGAAIDVIVTRMVGNGTTGQPA